MPEFPAPPRPRLHFAHANSYPAGTYRQYLDLLRTRFDVGALELHAHDPRYPVGNGWTALAQELVDHLAARYTAPVILVGHSLGGMLCLMAAKARPELVRCVVLLDSPVVAGWRALLVRTLRGTSLFANRFSPARFSVKRRTVWPDADSAYAHFAGKDLFARWAPGVLRDYMQSGLKPHRDGVQLTFTREAETATTSGASSPMAFPCRSALSAASIRKNPGWPGWTPRGAWSGAFSPSCPVATCFPWSHPLPPRRRLAT